MGPLETLLMIDNNSIQLINDIEAAFVGVVKNCLGKQKAESYEEKNLECCMDCIAKNQDFKVMEDRY